MEFAKNVRCPSAPPALGSNTKKTVITSIASIVTNDKHRKELKKNNFSKKIFSPQMTSQLYAVLGDFYTPIRRDDIDAKLKEILV